jgi:hypothetical protein
MWRKYLLAIWRNSQKVVPSESVAFKFNRRTVSGLSGVQSVSLYRSQDAPQRFSRFMADGLKVVNLEKPTGYFDTSLSSWRPGVTPFNSETRRQIILKATVKEATYSLGFCVPMLLLRPIRPVSSGRIPRPSSRKAGEVRCALTFSVP